MGATWKELREYIVANKLPIGRGHHLTGGGFWDPMPRFIEWPCDHVGSVRDELRCEANGPTWAKVWCVECATTWAGYLIDIDKEMREMETDCVVEWRNDGSNEVNTIQNLDVPTARIIAKALLVDGFKNSIKVFREEVIKKEIAI